MLYFVSRQAYWPTNELVVEIAAGGCDYANPDMLSDPGGIYGPLGDMLETSDPREALAAAFRVRDRWQELHGRWGDDAPIRIETGHTGGYTMPFESHPTDEQLREWADEAWEATPKCGRCGDPLPGLHPAGAGYRLPFPYEDEGEFCSEYCAEQAYWELEGDRGEND